MRLPHIVQYCSTYSSMSDISRLMPASPPLSHYFARIAIVRSFLAALLPKQTLASSLLARVDHSAQLLHVAVADVTILLLFLHINI